MQIKLPNLGEGADSGTVASILVSAGDQIEKEQTIIELESEKAVVPVPASAAGVVSKILVESGQQISVGTALLELEAADGDAAPEADPEPAQPAAAAAPASAPAPATRRRRAEVLEEPDYLDEVDESLPMPPASPSVRRAARDVGVDLRRIHGQGAAGRVLMSDLRAYVRWCQGTAFQRGAEAAKEGVFYPRSAPPVDFGQFGPILKKPVTQLRQVIAERMSESKRTIPHVTQFEEIDITDLNAMRKKLAPQYKEQGSNLSMTVITLMAVVDALKNRPIFNSSLDDLSGEIILKEYFHIGLAVDSEAGLMVPVIRDVDKKSPMDLAKELASLAAKVRDRKISPEEMKGGSFTISNQGAIGGAHFTPIINKPEVAIMGVGQSAMKPAVVGDSVAPRLMMPITISYDHRVIDGGEAARFAVDLKSAFASIDEARLKL